MLAPGVPCPRPPALAAAAFYRRERSFAGKEPNHAPDRAEIAEKSRALAPSSMYESLVLSPFARAVSRFSLAFFACLCATAVLLSLGCERQIAPPLVEVTELAPREVEPGDRLEVHGTGFPQGRTGRVTLEGTVFRPGEPPSRGVSIDLEGTVATPDRLEVVVRDSLSDRFCGRGDRAMHATFRGDVEVAFASNVAGAPPLVGVLRGATLDVMPSSARASVLEANIAEGRRVLAFLGVAPGAATARGIPVEDVRAGSLADRTGIQVGDVLAQVDGVNVLSLGDIVPASSRAVEITIRRGDSGTEETKTLSLIEYSGERIPTEYAPALVVVGLALAMLVLLVLPGPPALAALEMRIASRVRVTNLRQLLSALFGTGRHAALSALGSAVIAAFALTPYVVGREVDGVVLLAGAATMLVWSRMAVERGLLASLRAFARMFLVVVATAGAITLAIGQVGAIELAEIVRVQGGAPWQWSAAKHPSCAILAMVYGAAVVGLLRVRRNDAEGPVHLPLLERGGVLFASALAVTVFFGGWHLPGLVDSRARGLLLMAAIAFLAKTWVFTALLLATSRVLSSHRARDLQSLVAKRLLPGLVVGAALVAASRRIVPSVAIETAFGATLVAVAVLFGLRMAARVWAALSRPEPHASPFL